MQKENAQPHKNAELSAFEHSANPTTGFGLQVLHDQGLLTMSRIELLAIINQARAACSEPEVRRNQFNARVEDELEGTHYKKTVVTNENGTESVVFELSQDQCMLVSMRESKAVRHNVLDKLKSLGLPQTMAQALRLAADQAEQIEQQQAQLALAAPMVEFVERYVQPGTGSMGLREVCKLLGVKQNQLTAFLLDQDLMYRTTPQGPLTPRAKHVHAGRFEAKTGIADRGETSHAYVYYKFTPKGVERITGLWNKHLTKLASVMEAK